jgi:hypothetical protein
MLKIKKKRLGVLNKLDHRLTGESIELTEKTRMSLMQKLYKMAFITRPDHKKLNDELLHFHVELPKRPDASDLSNVNERYALAQSYFSRCTEIAMLAEGNFILWKRIKLLLDDHIAEKSADIRLSEQVKSLKVALQEATVRQTLKKEFRTRRVIESYLTEADSFRRTVEARKDDIAAVLTTISRQVKALSLEQNLNRG